MKAHVAPSICSGHVVIPPSKSMAHRAIICASLANGTSVIKNVAYSQDIKTTIAGMQQLGADIRMEADQVTVTGIKDFTIKNKEVFCCESGSTLRFSLSAIRKSPSPVKADCCSARRRFMRICSTRRGSPSDRMHPVSRSVNV